MAEENAVIIPQNERILELEKEVQRYMLIAPPPLKVSKKAHSRVRTPEFSSEVDKLMWELEEIKRCKDGHGSLGPKMYFYFNYCYILNLEEGMIEPEYRVADDIWFDAIHDVQDTPGYGIICVKRRRVGASWKEAADVLHDALFRRFYRVGMNSKSEDDSKELFKKVKFLFDNLPEFLRVKLNSNTQMFMDFSYYVTDDKGNKVKRGNQSEIIVRSPVVTAFEGLMLNKWVCDEAGKQKDLPQMWAYTEPTMMQETKRFGTPVLFGTSGDIGREGIGLRNMWKHADDYKLKKFFFAGWNGLMVDSFGNDMTEDAIRWIVYERKRYENLGPKLYNDFLQQYPLTIEEAFSLAKTGGVGDIIKINSQLSKLREEPPKVMRGFFQMTSDGIVFKQDPANGPVKMYEPVIKGVKNLYNAGADPADHDDVTEEASDLSLIIQRKQHGVKPPTIVLEYTDRPKEVKTFFNQALMALQYYNDTKVLIERNRYGMINYFNENDYKYLLSTSPRGITTLVNGRPANTLGLTVNDAIKDYIESLIEDYIAEYYEYIWNEDILQECVRWGAENTDRLMAWGMCLIQSKEDTTSIKKSTEKNKQLQMAKYVKVGKRVVRI